MTITPEIAFGFIALASGVLGWVISVEKRINGLKSLNTKVTRMDNVLERVDRRTERLSFRITGRDVAHGEPEGV